MAPLASSQLRRKAQVPTADAEIPESARHAVDAARGGHVLADGCLSESVGAALRADASRGAARNVFLAIGRGVGALRRRPASAAARALAAAFAARCAVDLHAREF